MGDRGDKVRACIALLILELQGPSSALQIRQQTVILEDARRAKETITSVKERAEAGNQPDLENFNELLHSIQVFEAEIFCQRQEWDRLLGIINVRL